MKQVVGTNKAPKVVGTYSQAIKAGNTVYLSGQIALDPDSMTLVTGDFRVQTRQVFKNIAAVAEAVGGSLSHIVKLTVYLTDIENYTALNEVMAEFYEAPYPARAVLGIKALPQGASVEMDAIMVLNE